MSPARADWGFKAFEPIRVTVPSLLAVGETLTIDPLRHLWSLAGRSADEVGGCFPLLCFLRFFAPKN